jgi:uncharacterized protein YdiU (UPF0061 family)
MNSHDKTLKRIHGLFAEGKTPKSITKEERKLLQTEYADVDWQTFNLPERIEQTKKETEKQTFERFEKAVNAGMKAAKAYISKGALTCITLSFSGYDGKIELDGERVIPDDDLIKEEQKGWKFVSKQKDKEVTERSAAEIAATKIEEQNELIQELLTELKKSKSKVKKLKKTANKSTAKAK